MRVRQVLLNLIGNAIKFTEQGSVDGARRRWTRTIRRRLRIDVRDTGIGIAPAQQAAIFEPFRQADGSIVRKFGGTGLGLAISKQLVEMMGGTIGFESAARRRQHVLLHAADRRRGSGAGVAARRAVADLDAVARAAHPRRRGQPGQPAPDPRAAREGSPRRDAGRVGPGAPSTRCAAPTPFDLVLMDIQMPGMDGFQATEAIRAMDGDAGCCPIVALTAHAQVGYETVCRRAGHERLPEQADRSHRAAPRADAVADRRRPRQRHRGVADGVSAPARRPAGAAGSMLRIAAIFQVAPSFTSSHDAHIRRVAPSVCAIS